MLDHHDREYVEFWDGVLQLRRTILPGYQTRQQAQSLLDLVETYYSTNERDDLKGLLQALVDDVGFHTYGSLDLLNKDEVLRTMQQIVDGVNIRDLEVLRASPAPEMIDEREESPDAQPHPPTTDPDKKQWVFVCDHCNADIRQKNDFHKHQQYGTQRSGFRVHKYSLTTAEWHGASSDGTQYQGRMQYFPGKNFPDWDTDFCERNEKIWLQQQENLGRRNARPYNKKITRSRINRGDKVELPN